MANSHVVLTMVAKRAESAGGIAKIVGMVESDSIDFPRKVEI
jgi:hypothetical protein